MAQVVPITLNEDNDEEIAALLTTNRNADGSTANPPIALDLTGMSLEAYLKVKATTSDTDPSTWKGTSTAGDVVVTDAVAGQVTVNIPASAITAQMGWWRIDVLSAAGKRKTAIGGTVTVTDW